MRALEIVQKAMYIFFRIKSIVGGYSLCPWMGQNMLLPPGLQLVEYNNLKMPQAFGKDQKISSPK